MIEKRVPKIKTTGNTARDMRSRGVGRKGVFRGVDMVVTGMVVVATPFAWGEGAGFAGRRSEAI
jgi:hypothetical protein